MARLGITLLLLLLPFAVRASMHWVVTENGMVESLSDTHMNMKRPWDLVEWLHQEERVELVNAIDNRLRESDRLIAKSASKDPGFETKFMSNNRHCRTAGKPLTKFDLYVPSVLTLEAKGIDSLYYLADIDFSKLANSELKAPLCEKISPLEFSSYAFEHLPGIQNRHMVSGGPEVFLYHAVVPSDYTPDQFGHMIFESFKKNSTSWVLYNLAAFYWRIKGSATPAIECLRRALHFSPRRFVDIALVSLANVLHLGKRSQDAAVLMHAALQISPNRENHHFMLGNVFAVLGDYNASKVHYQTALDIRASRRSQEEGAIHSMQVEETKQRLHAVQCLQALTTALEQEHAQLERTWKELQKFQQQPVSYENARDRIRKEEADHEMKMDAILHYEQQVLIEKANQVRQTCKMVRQDGRQFLKCSWSNIEEKQGQQRIPKEGSRFLAKHLANKEDPSKIEMARYKAKVDSMQTMQYLQSIDYSKPLRPPLYYHLEQAGSDRQLEDPQWPEQRECFTAELPAADKFPTVFLPAENKGFEVRALLTEALGLSRIDEHDLPWYPPQCMHISLLDPNEKSYDHLDAMKARYNIARPTHLMDKFFDSSMASHLKRLVANENARIEDIGQRIFTAMKQKLGADWILYNLAGLYWRVQGHLFFGIECQRRALYSVPAAYRDVALVNLANMFYKWDRLQDALLVMEDALAVNSLEPESHFFYGNLLAANGNLTGALHHYGLALRQNPEHAQAWKLAKACRCEMRRQEQVRNRQRQPKSMGPEGARPKPSEAENTAQGPPKELKVTIARLFREHKMCSDSSDNTDCDHIVSRMFQGRLSVEAVELPHVKLVQVGDSETVSNAKEKTARVLRGFLWNVHQHHLNVEDDECIIFNDTSRTIGCHVTNSLFPVSEAVTRFFFECLKLLRPHDFGTNRHSTLDLEQNKSPAPRDGTEFIKEQIFLSWPTWHDCIRHKGVDFSAFTSTLLTVEAKGVNVRSGELAGCNPSRATYPICGTVPPDLLTSLGLNASTIEAHAKEYSAEIGLKVFRGLDITSFLLLASLVIFIARF